MRNLLVLVAMAVLTFAAVGYYLDWYQIDRTTSLSGRQQFNIEIDGKKIAADVHRGAERGAAKVQDLLEKHRQAEAASKSSAKDSHSADDFEN
jgi:hypothetical protein